MKKFYVLLAAIVLIAGGLLLTGCSSSDAELVGRWQWDFDPNFITTFNQDGTGSHAIDWGVGDTFTWSTSGSNIVWNYPGYQRLLTPFSITDGALYITMDETVLRYIRIP